MFLEICMNSFIYQVKIRMKKSLQFLAVLLLLSCCVFAQERTWKTFSPESGAWSVFAPGELKPDAEAQETPSKQGSYTFNDSTGFFAVVYQDNPKWLYTLSKPFIGSHYKKVTKGFVKNSKGKLLKEQKFKNGDISGREAWIKIPEGKDLNAESQVKTRHRIQRVRMFFRENRFYLLLAVLPENEIDAFAIDNYFNSFKFK